MATVFVRKFVDHRRLFAGRFDSVVFETICEHFEKVFEYVHYFWRWFTDSKTLKITPNSVIVFYCCFQLSVELAGVCLILIIPEGAEYLYEMEEYPYDTPAEAQMIGTCLMGGFMLLLFSEKLFGSDHGKGSSIGIGMIIHGASDGVALAAANWTENSALEWIIFVGIFLHKLPASFGLSASIVNQPDMTKWSSLLMISKSWKRMKNSKFLMEQISFASQPFVFIGIHFLSSSRWFCHTRFSGSARQHFGKCHSRRALARQRWNRTLRCIVPHHSRMFQSR